MFMRVIYSAHNAQVWANSYMCKLKGEIMADQTSIQTLVP